MFENLSEKLDKAFKVLKGQGSISEINVAQTMKVAQTADIEGHLSANAQLLVAQTADLEATLKVGQTADVEGALSEFFTEDQQENIHLTNEYAYRTWIYLKPEL